MFGLSSCLRVIFLCWKHALSKFEYLYVSIEESCHMLAINAQLPQFFSVLEMINVKAEFVVIRS